MNESQRLIHKACGEQMGWRIGCSGRITAASFMRMDGTQPKEYERIAERCPHCGALINNMMMQVVTSMIEQI